jgi:Rad3-related DNA helicase
LGLTLLQNTLVLIDKAHNLPQAIANLQSATLSLAHTVVAQQQLQGYLENCMDRLFGASFPIAGTVESVDARNYEQNDSDSCRLCD